MSASFVFWTAIGTFVVVVSLYLMQEMIKFRRITRMFAKQDMKLEVIHDLVNSQLSEAVVRLQDAMEVVEAMRTLLVRLAPEDPRVQALARQRARGK